MAGLDVIHTNTLVIFGLSRSLAPECTRERPPFHPSGFSTLCANLCDGPTRFWQVPLPYPRFTGYIKSSPSWSTTGQCLSRQRPPSQASLVPTLDRVFHSLRPSTVLSRVSCRPFKLNIDRCYTTLPVPLARLLLGLKATEQGKVAAVARQLRSPSLRPTGSFYHADKTDGTTAGRLFALLPPAKPPCGEKRESTQRRFGTLAGPPPPVDGPPG